MAKYAAATPEATSATPADRGRRGYVQRRTCPYRGFEALTWAGTGPIGELFAFQWKP